MKLYGNELFHFGLKLIIIAAAITIVFLIIHLIRNSALKKQLEKEYGKKE